MSFFCIYIAAISIFSVGITCIDKYQAIHKGYRISEKMLLLIALAGGSFAMFLTMLVIRHKIRKLKFMFLLPFMVILHCVFIVYIYVC